MSLPALARVDRILLGILLLGSLLVALLHWLLAAPEKVGGLARVPSTFFNVASGAKAAYDVLDELKYPITRLRRRISPQSLLDVGVLFILRPDEGLAREEVAALTDWIEQGHALVVVPGAPADNLAFHGEERYGDDFLDDWFSFDETLPKPAKKTGDLPTADRAAPLRKQESSDRLTAGIAELAVPDERRFDAKSPCRGRLEDATPQVFCKDSKGPIGLRVELGEGTIIALADEYPLTNVGISSGDNGLLLANVVREMSARYPGKVAFDEFHLGFAEHDASPVAIVKLLLAGPWRWAALQAALVGVLALAARAVRFGSPQDVVRKPRRQHREFAEAAGRLFDEAGATSLAAETIYRYYRERICKLLLFDAQVEDRQLCEAAQRRAGPAVAAELRQAQEILQGTINRQKLLAVSQKLHRVAEALDHGT
jgi:hypothetical protein